MSYISASDITDMIINDFPDATISAKITLSDAAFEDLAESRGVTNTDDIETDPLHWKCKQWIVSWVCKEICFDAMGKNNIELVDFEKYARKYEYHVKRLQEYETELTYEMLLGTVAERRDRATLMTGVLYRG